MKSTDVIGSEGLAIESVKMMTERGAPNGFVAPDAHDRFHRRLLRERMQQGQHQEWLVRILFAALSVLAILMGYQGLCVSVLLLFLIYLGKLTAAEARKLLTILPGVRLSR